MAVWRSLGAAKTPALHYEPFLGRERHVPVSELAKRRIVFFYLRVLQSDNVIFPVRTLNTFAYTVHEFLVTLVMRAFVFSVQLS